MYIQNINLIYILIVARVLLLYNEQFKIYFTTD